MALMSKAAIVTGAAQGIGKAIAARLVKDGMRVAIVDINQEAAVAAAEELAGQYGAETMAVQCDVSQEEQVNTAVQKVLERFGTVDVLVNNAGILSLKKPFVEYTKADWDKIFGINFMLYTTKFNDVPEVEEDVCIPFGRARIVAEGADITVVTNSMMTIKAEKAVRQLQKEGISAELIDLRTIVPLDTETIIRSVKKTGKLLIVDEGHLSFGITGEIASRIMPDVFYDLDAPIQRMGTADVPLPFSPALEFPLIPDEKKIAAKIREMV